MISVQLVTMVTQRMEDIVDVRTELRWLEIVYWRVQPVPLNTATESRPMHAAFKLNMLRAHAQIPSKSLENLDFDQKYL